MLKHAISFSVICTLLLAFFVLPALAQVDTAWVRTYKGPDDNDVDEAHDVAVDASGNVYVTGESWHGYDTDYDYVTIKYYPNGDTAWLRRYNGPADNWDFAYAIALDNSGNVYVTGESVGSGPYVDYATVKYYANGDTAWARRYNGPADGVDEAHAIAVDASGNVYVTGESKGIGTNRDFATIKYYPNGDTAWLRRYQGPGSSNDEARAIAIDGSANVYVTGSLPTGGNDANFATIKYYSNGDTAWVRVYDGPAGNRDEAKALAVDGSGNVYVTGYSQNAGWTGDYVTIKYYPNGDTAWVRRYDGPANDGDGATAIAVDDLGNVYVTGYSYGLSGVPPYWEDYATVKYYPNGDTAWVRRYNGPGNSDDCPTDLALDDQGNVYVTGYSTGSGTSYDYATVKYDSSGNERWVAIYNRQPTFIDHARALAVDDFGNVCVTGQSDDEYATVKYVQTGPDVINYYVGDGPTSVFCADLDGVNGPDLSVTNGLSDSVSILKNNGNVSFQTPVNYATGDYPYSVFCVNLDLDSDLDLATANVNGDNCSIMKNSGNGIFQPKLDYVAGDSPRSVFLADLDDDTDQDLVVAVCGKDSVCIRLNKDGMFSVPYYYAAGDCPFSVYCADLDGVDGPDIAVANWDDDSVSILINNGDGTFQSPVNYGAGDTPASVFCADLDGASGPDLAVANWDSDNVSVLMNNGDGTFQAAVNYTVGDAPRSVFCADLDQDTDIDLVTANQNSDSVSLLMNNGDGTFQAAVNYPVGDAPRSVYCANLDGNSYPDIAVANFGSDNVSLLFNPGMSTDVEDEEEFEQLPEAYYLSQNYPNPFNPNTNIEFVLHRSGEVRIDIYDILGRKIKTLVDQEMSPGRKLVDWDGRDDSGKQVASGIYFYRLRIRNYAEVKKMLLLK